MTFAAQPHPIPDDISRQRDILAKEMPIRLCTTTAAYVLSTAFLPWQITLPCWAANIAAELASHALLRGLDPARMQWRYWSCLVLVVVMEVAYLIPASLIWMEDGPYVKAFAVGMVSATILHLTTVRAIHLPIGLAGLSAVTLAAIIVPPLTWLEDGEYGSLVTGLGAAFGMVIYAVTAMISNNRLHRETAMGQAEARAANAAKERFLAQMSHELRTPLNAILGMGHAELYRSNDPVSHENLHVLIRSAEGLNRVLDDILDLSAIGAGKLPIRPVPVSLRDEIEAIVTLFRPSAERWGLSLDLQIMANLPDHAELDPQRLRQCLSNLLSNAIKHTASGGIHLIARQLLRKDGPPLLQITLKDTGVGILPQDSERVFEPFQTGSETRDGLGLGLPISRALARQMGGDLVLATQTDGQRGSTFVLTLALGNTAIQLPMTPANVATGKPLAGRHILVVDDIATNRKVAAVYLDMLGATYDLAASGPEALCSIERRRPDAVLLDLNMPGMSGHQTFSALRGRGHVQFPIVAMTADAMEEQRCATLALGLDGYLAKPVSPDSMASALLQVLARG